MIHAFGALRLIAVAAGAFFGLVVQAQTPGTVAPSAATSATTTPSTPQKAPPLLRTAQAPGSVRVVADAPGAVVTVPLARARLAGHALLPFETPFSVPSDAGPDLTSSGKYAPTAHRASGVTLPFKGQIVQGVAGIVPLKRDEFLVLSDNGFDTRAASRDVLLAIHRMRPNWDSGQIDRRESILLRDPARVLPFPITNATSKSRYLTGADLSPQSLQVVDNELWVGDSYGPYIVRFDMKGKAIGLLETTLRSHTYRSAEHHAFTAEGGKPENSAEVRPGGGIQAMALSIDGSRLYPVLSRPLIDPATREAERAQGSPVVRILEVDTHSKQYTGRYLRYALEDVDHIVSDFQMLTATTGLLIERDDTSEGGEPSCPGSERTDCYTQPARYKRLVKIDLSRLGPDRMVRKVAAVDLTQIENPNGMAKLGPNGPSFGLPHRSPSALAVVNPTHVVIVNDHNAPLASSREIDKPDATEFTRLDLSDLVEIQ